MRKFIAPGVLSALFFLGFFYFIYNAESAKYEEKNETKPVKEYDETVITQVNTEVAKAMRELANEKNISSERIQAYAPTETIVYETVEPQAAPTQTPETYIATAILQTPPVSIPSIPSSITIPSITPITPVAVPKVPTPQPSPTIQPAPVVTTQPRQAAPQPRTTVS